MLIPSVPHVHRWLDAHPDRDDPDAPLWSKLHQCEEISDRMVSKILDEAADRGGEDAVELSAELLSGHHDHLDPSARREDRRTVRRPR